MRILALVTEAFGGYGGIARYNCDLFTAIGSVSADVEILILPRIRSDRTVHIDVKIEQLKSKFSRAAYVIHAAYHAIKYRPEVIFCGHIYHGPLALRLARALGAKLVSQLHGTEVWTPLKPRHLEPLTQSDLVLCVSRDTKARYERQAETAGNSFVLANTVGKSFTVGDSKLARQRLDVSDCVVLSTVARLDPREGYKGHDRVIEALPRLAAPDGRPIIYLIAGTGGDRKRLESLAKSHGVQDRVRFLGKVPDTDLSDLYRASDVFVLASTGEGFGIVYLEAMACGTPAVGLAVGGVYDALGDGELGVLSEPGADLAAALQQLVLEPKPDRQKLSDAVHRRFGADAFCTRVSQALMQLEGDRSQVGNPSFLEAMDESKRRSTGQRPLHASA